MKRQGTLNSHPSEHKRLAGDPGREQGSGRLARLLREAVRPVGSHAVQSEDLWPAMQHRLRAEAGASAPRIHLPWFDLALAGGLVLLLAAFPTWIPVLLYYL